MNWRVFMGHALVIHCALLSLTATLAAEPAVQLQVLGRFVGTWQVTTEVRRPKRAVVTHTETYSWDLGGHFLHGDSGIKSDGTRDLVFATYDQASGGYPFWIFSSSGAWFYLAPGKWDEAKRTLTWENPPSLSLTYRSRCVFPDRDTRHCEAQVSDWKGTVVLDQRATAIRRR